MFGRPAASSNLTLAAVQPVIEPFRLLNAAVLPTSLTLAIQATLQARPILRGAQPLKVRRRSTPLRRRLVRLRIWEDSVERLISFLLRPVKQLLAVR